MSWQELTNGISKVADKPITIVSTVTVLVGLFVLLVISNTSIGKKTLNKLSGLCNNGQELAKKTLKIAEESNEKVKEVETLANNKLNELAAFYEEKTKELEKAYETKVACVVSILNTNEEHLFSILEKIPNAQVQKELIALKKDYAKRKEEITNVVGVLYEDYEELKEQVRAEYSEKINFLESRIQELTLYFNEMKQKEE